MKKIRIGIFGAWRGFHLSNNLLLNNAEVAAVCDHNEDRLKTAGEKLHCDALFTSFDEFIEHPMDAVLIANYFHEHAPYAIRALEKGIHVLSECTSNGTMAEGVELIRAAEKSKAIYMLCENYPHMKFNREMKRVVEGGTLGKIMFAEGEYNHPGNPWDAGFKNDFVRFPKHWRNTLPSSYYITHSLAPIMWATGSIPKTVTAFNITIPEDRDVPVSKLHSDRTAIVMTHNNDSSVFRVTGCASFGGHENSYRICGTEGMIENLRGMNDKIMLRYNEWSKPEGAPATRCYDPDWNDKDATLIEKAGHGGGDFLVIRDFLDCIRQDKKPDFDEYFATTMASVAIQAHRSALNGGMPYEIPDFHTEEARKKYENDHDTPFYSLDGREPNIRYGTDPDYKPTESQYAKYLDMIKNNKFDIE